MENKQTAIEWLEIEIDNKDMGEVPMWIYDFIQQAKQLEKEQIVRAYNSGELVEIFELNTTLSGETYYANNYDTTTGLPEEDSKRRAWHY
jgi:hypothetical protein